MTGETTHAMLMRTLDPCSLPSLLLLPSRSGLDASHCPARRDCCLVRPVSTIHSMIDHRAIPERLQIPSHRLLHRLLHRLRAPPEKYDSKDCSARCSARPAEWKNWSNLSKLKIIFRFSSVSARVAVSRTQDRHPVLVNLCFRKTSAFDPEHPCPDRCSRGPEVRRCEADAAVDFPRDAR